MNKKHVMGYSATALIALGIGSVGASGGGDQTAAPAVTTTATVTAPPTTVAQVSTSTVTQTLRPTSTVRVTVTAPRPEPAVAMAGEGLYEVGVDVKPGKYVSTPADSGNCYWARLSGPNTSDDIVDNGNSAGQVVVTIAKSDKFFESSGCNDWVRR